MVIEHGGRLLPTMLEEIVHPQHTAVVVVDMQNDFISKGGVFDKYGFRLTTNNGIIKRINVLLEEARKIGIQVAYLQQTNLPNYASDTPASIYYGMRRFKIDDPKKYPAYCVPGTWGHQIIDELKPQDGDFIIVKNRQSGYNTNLDFLLRTNNLKTLIITGLDTEGSVRANAQDYNYRGYFIVIPKDCVDSFSKSLHEAALKLMAGYAESSDKIIEIWKHKPIKPSVL